MHVQESIMKLYNITSPHKTFTDGAKSWGALLAKLETYTAETLVSLFGHPYNNGQTWYLTASPIKGGPSKQIEVRVDGLGWTEATFIK